MLKSINKLRAKRKKKAKQGNNVADENLSDRGDNCGSFADSRNSSKASLPISEDGSLNNGLANSETPSHSVELLESEDELPKPSKPSNTVIKAEDLYEVFINKHADEDRLFRAEFEAIPAYVAAQKPNCSYAKKPENKEKNRYKNVITCDESRVVLAEIDDVACSDYINASYIDGYTAKQKFIAAQGPKENTLADFWRMVWEKRCYVIVMITELCEVGRYMSCKPPTPIKLPGQKKCEQYWPDDGSIEYGKILVQLESTFEYGSFTKRSLKVTNPDQPGEPPRMVSQFQYRAWPDHGVPKTTSEIFRFRLRTLEAQPEGVNAGPIVVHCSAGVGRTGTYIALDVLLGYLLEEGFIDVFDLIAKFRTKRTEMVQSLDQYVLLHKLLAEYHLFGDTDVKTDDFESQFQQLERIDEETGRDGFESQFERLAKSWPINSRFGPGGLPQNQDKNRDEKIVPYEHSKVFVRMRPKEQVPIYCNASSLDAYDAKTFLIASQGPLENTAEDFWRVVIDNCVTCVVMLTPLMKGDEEQCHQYWPDEDSAEFGEVTVSSGDTVQHEYFSETQLNVTCDQITSSIAHVRYLVWEDEESPPPQCGAALLEIASFVAQQLKKLSGNVKPRILIHCSDGAGRTGVLCSVVNLLERLKREERIDVFRSVKDLRDCRPLMVRSKVQYKLCYDTLRQHLANTNQSSQVEET